MMKPWISLGIGLLLAACAVIPNDDGTGDGNPGDDDPLEGAGSTASLADGDDMVEVLLEDFGPAPELENEVWLNTDVPLRLANLRGQVVLLDMWTFG